jgi:hypothetical protein
LQTKAICEGVVAAPQSTTLAYVAEKVNLMQLERFKKSCFGEAVDANGDDL